jgi:hypothetical protein
MEDQVHVRCRDCAIIAPARLPRPHPTPTQHISLHVPANLDIPANPMPPRRTHSRHHNPPPAPTALYAYSHTPLALALPPRILSDAFAGDKPLANHILLSTRYTFYEYREHILWSTCTTAARSTPFAQQMRTSKTARDVTRCL